MQKSNRVAILNVSDSEETSNHETDHLCCNITAVALNYCNIKLCMYT